MNVNWMENMWKFENHFKDMAILFRNVVKCRRICQQSSEAYANLLGSWMRRMRRGGGGLDDIQAKNGQCQRCSSSSSSLEISPTNWIVIVLAKGLPKEQPANPWGLDIFASFLHFVFYPIWMWMCLPLSLLLSLPLSDDVASWLSLALSLFFSRPCRILRIYRYCFAALLPRTRRSFIPLVVGALCASSPCPCPCSILPPLAH